MGFQMELGLLNRWNESISNTRENTMNFTTTEGQQLIPLFWKIKYPFL